MKYVLVACEESQTVTSAFRARGLAAYSCDLQKCSGGHPEWHIQIDCRCILRPPLWVITDDGIGHFIPRWDLIIAHPPCTFLAKSGARWLFDSDHCIKDFERFGKLLSAASFFRLFLNLPCPTCIENPTPLKIAHLPECTQVIQPYEFGSPFSKRTCLWLYNLPKLHPTNIVKPESSFVLHHPNGKLRSKFFPEIADAMAEQWGDII